jgi:hypothetical protein
MEAQVKASSNLLSIKPSTSNQEPEADKTAFVLTVSVIAGTKPALLPPKIGSATIFALFG